MTALNWVLAIGSAVLWGGGAVWYFRKMVHKAWVERNDEWFRD